MRFSRLQIDPTSESYAPKLSDGLNFIFCPHGALAGLNGDLPTVAMRRALWGGGVLGDARERHVGRLPLGLSWSDAERTPAGAFAAAEERAAHIQALGCEDFFVVDFENVNQLTELAMRACELDRREAGAWASDLREPAWRARRDQLTRAHREVAARTAASRQQLNAVEHDIEALEHSARVAEERVAATQRELDALVAEPPLVRRPPRRDPVRDPRLTALDQQIERVTEVCRDVHARQADLNNQLIEYQRSGDGTPLETLRDLHGVTETLQRELDWVSSEAERSTAALWNRTDVDQLGSVLRSLQQLVDRQEEILDQHQLRTEARHLERCKKTLTERLQHLRQRRAELQLFADDVAEHREREDAERLGLFTGQPDYETHARRQRLRGELDDLTSTWNLRRSEWADARARRTEIADRLEREVAELESLEAELAHVPLPGAATAPASGQRRPLLAVAAQYLRQMTGGQLSRLRFDFGLRRLYVGEHSGASHLSHVLEISQQRQVALSLCLAAAEFTCRQVGSFPIVLESVFRAIDPQLCRRTGEALHSYCAAGRQLLVIVTSEMEARKLNDAEIYLHGYHDRPASMPRDWVRHRQLGDFSPEGVNGTRGQDESVPRAGSSPFPAPAPLFFRTDPQSPRASAARSSEHSLPLFQAPRSPRGPLEPTVDAAVQLPEMPAPHTPRRDVRYYLEYLDLISQVPFVPVTAAKELETCGVWTVADLIRGDADRLAAQADGHFSARALRSWQSQAVLMCSIARLRAYDARILVACGITDPVQLQDMEPAQLLAMVEDFVQTPEGHELVQAGSPFEISRISRWIESAQRARHWFHPAAGYRSPQHFRRERRESPAPAANRRAENAQRRRDLPAAEPRSGAAAASDRTAASASPGEARRRAAARRAEAASAGERTSTRRAPQESRPAATTRELTFYLEQASDVEAAPTIGPKTAERLYEIGIHTVADLLDADPATVAERLDHPRVKAETVLEWQQQAALVCQIPELRGHDAQLLVACGITTPGDLARIDPGELFSVVSPFVKTKAGSRIVRNGKEPTLEEVTQWTRCAKHYRQLRAA